MRNKTFRIIAGILCVAIVLGGCAGLKRNKGNETDDLPEGIEIDAATAAAASAEAEPTATPTPAPVSLSGYQGVYVEELTQAGTLRMQTGAQDAMNISIEWKTSNGDTFQWTMTGVYDDSTGLIRYDDAQKMKKAAGNTGATPVSTPQTGSFKASGMRVIWEEGCDLMAQGTGGNDFIHPEFIYSMTLEEYEASKQAAPTPTAIPQPEASPEPTVTPTPETADDSQAKQAASAATEEPASEEGTSDEPEGTEEEGATESAEEQEKIYYVTADELNVRTAPSTESDVIDALLQDQEVHVLEHIDDENTTSGWYRIEYEGVDEAYVSAEFLSER